MRPEDTACDSKRRGSSPVVGIVLMIAVVVVLASVVSVFAFSFPSSLDKERASELTNNPPATNARITTLDVSNAAGRYSAIPSKNGFTRIVIDSVQPSGATVYVEISDEALNGYGVDTITDTIVASDGSTGVRSYEMCADITTRNDNITVTVYSQNDGTKLAQETVEAGTDGSPSGPNDLTDCSIHPG